MKKDTITACLLLFVVITVIQIVYRLIEEFIPIDISWILCVLVLVVALIYSKKHPKQQDAQQPTTRSMLRNMFLSPQKKWEQDKEKYKEIIGKLPSDLVHELHSTLYETGLSMGLPSEDLPDELCKVGIAAQAIINEGTYGTITEEQRLKISKLLDDFEWVKREYIPAAKKALSQLYGSDGLGFDLITNSAADAALYSAMNTHEKIKGNEKRIEEYKQSVDRDVVSLVESIQQVIS